MNRIPPRLVLVGGGHAHIQVIHDFARDPPDCRLTLLVDRATATYSGMVPGFVAGQYSRDELGFDLRGWAERVGADLVLARAVDLDPERKLVIRADGEPVPYDICSWNIGSTVAGLEVPGAREHTLPTRPIGDFVDRVHGSLAAALDARAGEALRLVIVGGGAAGVELALCMQCRALAQGASAVSVDLFSVSDELLHGSPPALRRRIERELRRRDIRAHCGERVVEVHRDGVQLASGDRAPADLVVWVTGAATHLALAVEPGASTPAIEPGASAPGGGPRTRSTESGLRLTSDGWIPVRETLQHVDHDELFAAGDCAQLEAHPRVAKAGVYAVRMGPVLARNLRGSLAGAALESYRPQRDFLALLNLGDGRAAGSKWGCSFSGRWVMRWKDRIDRAFMTRFR